MKEKEVGFYTLAVPGDDRVYVGSSANLAKRKSVHKSLLNKNKHYNKDLQTAFNNTMKPIIEFNSITTNTREEAFVLEQKVMDEKLVIGKLFNTAPNAKIPSIGRVFSEETKEKLRNKPITDGFRRKMSNINTGRKHSEETKQKLSEIRSGEIRKPLSTEHREKISIANTGKKASPETIEKLRQTHLGISNGPMSEKQKQQISIANKGRKRTPEQIENIRQARLNYLERTRLEKLPPKK